MVKVGIKIGTFVPHAKNNHLTFTVQVKTTNDAFIPLTFKAKIEAK